MTGRHAPYRPAERDVINENIETERMEALWAMQEYLDEHAIVCCSSRPSVESVATFFDKYRLSCDECGREGPAVVGFSDAVAAWNRSIERRLRP